MSTKKFLITTTLVVLPALLLIVYSRFSTVKAQNESASESSQYSEVFMAHLDGSQEVPPISTTTAMGHADIKVRRDNTTSSTTIEYTLGLQNITNVTAAHFHCAAPGQNGPVIVPILSHSAGQDYASSSVSGTITWADVLPAAMNCSPNIQTMEHFIQAMREGKIYVNVHTTENPNGEIRGQVMTGNLMPMMPSATSTATSTMPTPTPTPTPTPSPTPVATSTDTTATTTTPFSTGLPGHYFVFVSPDSYYKMQGGAVSFTGTHFYPGETVTIRRDGTVVGTAVANASGQFMTGNVDIPYASGQRSFTFIGSVSNISFPVGIWVDGSNPWLSLSTYYAGDAAPITITGHGFGSGEEVTVWFDGMNRGMVLTSQNGEFSLTTVVPDNTAGQKTVEAKGSRTGAVAQQSFSQAF
ncbi:CHRD domain-containing protein [Candidatus Parcubacteria bacterium]|nr:CHRD domain-containing protein [Candidatus Parcubacteria bacterium]